MAYLAAGGTVPVEVGKDLGENRRHENITLGEYGEWEVKGMNETSVSA